MSSYRDDSQDTAVAGDSTWIRLSAITEDAAKIASVLLFGLLVTHLDSAAASDEVFGRTLYLAQEQAAAGDAVFDGLHARDLVADRAVLADQVAGRLRVLHADAAMAMDEVVDQSAVLTVDSAHIGDEVLAQRRVHQLVSESAHITDFAAQFASMLLIDQVAASDRADDRVRARAIVADGAALADETFDGRQSAGAMVADQARISSMVQDHLLAHDLVADGAAAEGVVLGAAVGQAWTANTDTWAMSRYAPYTFHSVAVIDGVLYGVADDGVYALDGGAQPIAGRVATGKLDLGKGVLVHPLAAYLEYELDGTASLEVTTTQSGAAETYSYALEQEPAGELTNGRFNLGRGLRGRHFSFALNLTGLHAEINDLRVETAPTKRRV